MGGFFLTNVKAKFKNTESVEPNVIVTVQKAILFSVHGAMMHTCFKHEP